MNKKFTTLATSVFVALLVSAFAFTVVGCGDPETEYVDKWNTSYVEVGGGGFQPPEGTIYVTSEAALRALLQDTNEGTANIEGTTLLGSLSDDLTIPAGKNLYVSGNATLAKHITVNGTLHVYSGALTTAAGGKLKIDGEVVVESRGGLIDGATLAEITDGAATADTTTVGTKVTVKEGGSLTVQSGDIAAAAGTYKNTLAATWGFADEGSLTVAGGAISDAAATLAAVTALSGLDSGKRTLTVTINSPTDAASITSLTIPAGLRLTTDSALTAVTSLTVNGRLTAGSAVITGAATATTVTVGDNARLILNSGSGTIGKLAASLEIGVGATFAGTVSDADGKAINIKEAATVDIITAGGTAVANVSPGASVNGITIPGNAVTPAKLTGLTTAILATLEEDFTVPAGGILEIDSGSTLTIKATKKLTLAGAGATLGAKITGAGKIRVGQSDIVGGVAGWQAVGTGNIVITADSADESSIAASAAGTTLTATGVNGDATRPSITANVGKTAGNNLTIAADTTIALGGVGAAPVGSIVLTDNANKGKLTLAAASAVITTGNADTNTVINGAATSLGGATVGASVVIKADSETGGGTNYVGSITGAASTNTITTTAASTTDITISSATGTATAN
ncbi:MAG: hypothetical protein Ta2F_12150 [Termitinemataceae bacterium]|nr:MAG: hypothetical protein Ta2F_12150 [Termitinemataceae bacterium]